MVAKHDLTWTRLMRIGYGLLIASGLLVAVGYVLIQWALYANVPPGEWDRPLRGADLSTGYYVGAALMCLSMIVFLGGAWVIGFAARRELSRARAHQSAPGVEDAPQSRLPAPPGEGPRCGGCGTMHPPGARYCMGCGGPLTPG